MVGTKLFGAGVFAGNSIGVFNMANTPETFITNLAKPSPAASENGTRGFAYSRHSGLLLAQGANNNDGVSNCNRIQVIDPGTPSIKGYVTVGNLDTTNVRGYTVGNQLCVTDYNI